MDIRVVKSKLNGSIAVPGSKSHSIRAAVCAMLGKGISLIHSPLNSEDTRSCLNAASHYGAEVVTSPDMWTITGTGGKLRKPKGMIDLGNSGTSLRILSGIAAAMDFESRFDGDASLRTRVMEPLLEALTVLGATVESTSGKCPLSISGPLKGGEVTIDGTSSQFVTALLFAAPLATGEVKIKVNKLNEKPYVELTLDWLRRLGIKFTVSEDLHYFTIPGMQTYPSFQWTIPADFSTAAFPLAAAAITGSNIIIRNLNFDDLQGDKAVFDFFRKMGMRIETKGNSTSVMVGDDGLKGIDIDLNSTPDALPAMAAAAVFSRGTTRLLNVPQARIKETDRITCMCQELSKMGAVISELPDGLVIEGTPLHGAVVDGHGDHRIVMALALAGLGADGETIVTGAEAAAVTYPDFVNDFRKIGASIEVIK
ncbi:MAG: 3-phosphoshikimate 1-carboxyvinyltransferase [Victivallaceae bacterium]|nr:3-phosphoshikimate 1-carboxyvinyltransferase [Victivallaceae bacterium]